MSTTTNTGATPGVAPAPARAISIALLAMGGEGGGVVADWLVDLAEHNGYFAQTTSVPGVAQRTGATIYYVELFPEAAAGGRQPVLALMPVPGEVDLVVASELMEAGRAVQRGLVTPDRTTLVASTHRVYAMLEKMAMGDGRVDSDTLFEGCRAAARELLHADFAKLAEDNGSVIGASLFGAIAASGRVPFPREAFEAAIRGGGVGVESSLRAFAAGFDAARASVAAAKAIEAAAALPSAPASRFDDAAGPGAAAMAPAEAPAPTITAVSRLPASGVAAGAASAAASSAAPASASPAPAEPALGPRLAPLATMVRNEFPAVARPAMLHALLRLADYQDVAYAADYVERMRRLLPVEQRHGDGSARLTEAVARGLALWMSYEDTVRVADLKTRRGRFERVGQEVRVAKAQMLEINEFLHPRVEEIADTLPAGLGRWLLATPWARGLVGRFTTQGRVVRTTSVRGFLLLYGVASLRRIRRSSLRYVNEHARIAAWLDAIIEAARTDYALAIELAECQRLVKGYGDTHVRGTRSFEQVMGVLPMLRGRADAAASVRRLREAALADDAGHALSQALSQVAAA